MNCPEADEKELHHIYYLLMLKIELAAKWASNFFFFHGASRPPKWAWAHDQPCCILSGRQEDLQTPLTAVDLQTYRTLFTKLKPGFDHHLWFVFPNWRPVWFKGGWGWWGGGGEVGGCGAGSIQLYWVYNCVTSWYTIIYVIYLHTRVFQPAEIEFGLVARVTCMVSVGT